MTRIRVLATLLLTTMLVAAAPTALAQPPEDEGSNCMDGKQANETCRDDVYYMAPPDDAGQDAAADEDADTEDARTVPGPATAAAIVGIAVALGLVVAMRFGRDGSR